MAVDVGRYDQLRDQVILICDDSETTATAQEEDLQKTLQSGISRYKRVAVGVGLLCAVLALLNIVLLVRLNQFNKVDNQTIEIDQQLLTSCMQLQRMLETPGWLKLGSSCYYVSTEEKNWDESRQWCRDRYSDLIVIKSKEKQDFVERLNKTVWLGLTDREREGSFQWVDGTPLTTPTYWMPGQPAKNPRKKDGEKQHCVEFDDGALGWSPDRGWSDTWCTYSSYWICERVC